jgi:hypothetical protein
VTAKASNKGAKVSKIEAFPLTRIAALICFGSVNSEWRYERLRQHQDHEAQWTGLCGGSRVVVFDSRNHQANTNVAMMVGMTIERAFGH